MRLTEEQIAENYQKLIEVIEKYFTGERKEKLLALYDKLADRIATAPASSVNTFHGCYAGGYASHVLGVVKNAIQMYSLWKENGAFVDDYTLDELVFVALNHDLGKIGDMEHDYYIPNTSEWHVKNQGKVYVDNPELVNMAHADRSLWLLQENGIPVSQNEFLAIKLHDGPYSDENRGYFNAYQEHRKIRCNMIYILHYADIMAARIEFEQERTERLENPAVASPKTTGAKGKLSEGVASKSATELFSKLFDGNGKKE